MKILLRIIEKVQKKQQHNLFHLNGAFRWRADHSPLRVVFGSPLSKKQKKNKTKRCQSWTPSDKLSASAHDDAEPDQAPRFVSAQIIYTQQKKLRKSQKTMQHKNTKAKNYTIFIYLFRYMLSVYKHVYFKLLAPIPLL